MKQLMNEDVDPCKDFYEFVCGKYVQNVNTPAGKLKWTVSDDFEALVDLKFKDILENTEYFIYEDPEMQVLVDVSLPFKIRIFYGIYLYLFM